MSCGVGCRCRSDPVLLWLWRRPAGTAPIRPPSLGISISCGYGPLKKKKSKKKAGTLSDVAREGAGEMSWKWDLGTASRFWPCWEEWMNVPWIRMWKISRGRRFQRDYEESSFCPSGVPETPSGHAWWAVGWRIWSWVEAFRLQTATIEQPVCGPL